MAFSPDPSWVEHVPDEVDVLCVGELHPAPEHKLSLEAALPALRARGFDTLGVECVPSDRQDLLEEFAATGESADLRAHLAQHWSFQATGHQNNDYYLSLLQTASQCGFRLVAVDHDPLRDWGEYEQWIQNLALACMEELVLCDREPESDDLDLVEWYRSTASGCPSEPVEPTSLFNRLRESVADLPRETSLRNGHWADVIQPPLTDGHRCVLFGGRAHFGQWTYECPNAKPIPFFVNEILNATGAGVFVVRLVGGSLPFEPRHPLRTTGHELDSTGLTVYVGTVPPEPDEPNG